jgi:hypothetical protein
VRLDRSLPTIVLRVDRRGRRPYEEVPVIDIDIDSARTALYLCAVITGRHNLAGLVTGHVTLNVLTDTAAARIRATIPALEG